MGKINRVFQKIFAESAPSSGSGAIGEFGSFANGLPTLTTSIETIMSLAAWGTGWLDSVVGKNAPPIEDMNAVDYVLSKQLAYLFQAGIPEWDTQTPYYTNSVCIFQGVEYQSVIDNNVGNDPSTDLANWRTKSSTPAGVTAPFAGITVPRDWLLCDASAISRTTYVNLFNALSIRTTGNYGTGASIISSIPDTSKMAVGYPISGPNIQAGTVITSIDSASQIHISLTTTGAQTGAAIVIAPWGVGNGTTTFNLPGTADKFVRGLGTGVDAARILGSSQADAFKSHTHTQDSHNHTQDSHNHTQDSHNHTQAAHSHTFGVGTGAENAPTVAARGPAAGANNSPNTGSTTATNVAATATNQAATAVNQAATAVNQSTGGAETRPTNVAMNFIIKI